MSREVKVEVVSTGWKVITIRVPEEEAELLERGDNLILVVPEGKRQ